MKERPILMTPENAQKVFDGTKTQTRRILKSQPWEWLRRIDGPAFYAPTKVNKRTGEEYPGDDVFGVYDHTGEWGCVCPFGRPGDRLWIREAWAPCDACHMEIYKGQGVRNCPHCDESASGLKFTPSIHMHRWVCRTVVELTKVWVERVQDIQEEDAGAEGAAFMCSQCGCDLDTQEGSEVHAACDDLDCNQGSYREGFRRLWNSINGKGSWALNPWVWVLTMRKVES